MDNLKLEVKVGVCGPDGRNFNLSANDFLSFLDDFTIEEKEMDCE